LSAPLRIVTNKAGVSTVSGAARPPFWYLFQVGGKQAPRTRHSRWRDRQYAARLKGRMRHTTYMPKLQNDLAASVVNLLDHFFPCGNLSSGMNARSGRIALAIWRDLRSLRDDQTAG